MDDKNYSVDIYKGDARLRPCVSHASLDDAVFHMEAAQVFDREFDAENLEFIVYDESGEPVFSMRAQAFEGVNGGN